MGGQSATGDLLAHIIDSHPAKAKLDTAQDSFAAVQKVLDEAVGRKGLSSAVELASKAFIYPDFRGQLHGDSSHIAERLQATDAR
jgi:ribulose kinase